MVTKSKQWIGFRSVSHVKVRSDLLTRAVGSVGMNHPHIFIGKNGQGWVEVGQKSWDDLRSSFTIQIMRTRRSSMPSAQQILTPFNFENLRRPYRETCLSRE